MQTSQFETKFTQALQVKQSGLLLKSMQLFYQLHEELPDNEAVLVELLKINLQTKQLDHAKLNLHKLIKLSSSVKAYYDQLARIYATENKWTDACDTMHAFILVRPKLADAHFNLGYYLNKLGKHNEALQSYEKSIQLGLSGLEEAYLNMAVIYTDYFRDPKKAKDLLVKALEINPDYTLAIYNLANYYEDMGDRLNAIKEFETLIKLEPENSKVLYRLAYVKKFTDISDPLIEKLKKLSTSSAVPRTEMIDINYALGKALDECGQYNEAFSHYKMANHLNKPMISGYKREDEQEKIDNLIEFFDSNWVNDNQTKISTTPIFICGMFRSGSTLLEQVLSAHDDVTAGGERRYFTNLVQNKLKPFPQALTDVSQNQFQVFAKDYDGETKSLYKGANYVTDKRPDNVNYIGLIKTLFPNAKIIFTQRNPVDVCLSIYFLRFGEELNYSTDLLNIAHFYKQQQRIINHWMNLFPNDTYRFDYEQMIATPKESISKALEFLNLEWSDKCLSFHTLNNPVKTASAWQVREPLYTKSAGRWKNYLENPEVKALANYLGLS